MARNFRSLDRVPTRILAQIFARAPMQRAQFYTHWAVLETKKVDKPRVYVSALDSFVLK